MNSGNFNPSTLSTPTRPGFSVQPRYVPPLDPDHVPAVLWNAAYRRLVEAAGGGRQLDLALVRTDGTCFTHTTRLLPVDSPHAPATALFVERLVKFLLWQKGGSRILVAGQPDVAALLRRSYAADGARAFDVDVVGSRMFGAPLTVEERAAGDLPSARSSSEDLGRHLDGCRIGFDLGGSDRKCAALIDGKVVFSEEIPWDPYFQKDPAYHLQGINDSLQRAAARLPRVDAIGGSAAGVYVNNEVRIASLFRGIAPEVFDREVRPLFLKLREQWGVPFEVVNDGEVTALAGSMSLNENGVLGISMGTSLAAGYCDQGGHITQWINELAFAPMDYRENGPVDEWSGDQGCGVQYFSQQGVARLAPLAGLDFPKEMPFAERLVAVQKLMAAGDEKARRIYETIGICFGYTIAHYADFYDFKHLLILGRVTSGEGGNLIIRTAEEVLRGEFPALAERIRISTPNEQDKRHGQAIAAASLPVIHQPGKMS